jgi:phosphoribosylformylglycinamidine synthase
MKYNKFFSMSKTETNIHHAEVFGMPSKEFDRVVEILGRNPNLLELEIFSILWSEHASYKHSLKWLKLLPRSGSNVVVEAGRDISGAVDIGDDEVCVFKLESHNHPCAVQPRLGASTGLRAVTRDVFAMGALPLAFLDSLRFGNDSRDTARWLFDEVIKGLSDFERRFDVPIVGGETFFCDTFNSSPIVNNMVIGVAKKDELVSAVARGKGNLIAVIGLATGSEGVDGDAFAADVITGHGTKQTTFDFMKTADVEKSLFRIIRKLIEEKLVIGIQPVGGQGIVGAITEMAARGNSGVTVTTKDVPRRDEGLSPRDILVSETWGRLLLCFDPDKTERIKSVVLEEGVDFGILGEVNDSRRFQLIEEGGLLADIPVEFLGLGGKAPVYDPPFEDDDEYPESVDIETLPEPDHYPAVVRRMISSLNLVSKKDLSKQFYRSLSEDDPSVKYPSDASIIEVSENGKSLLATIDCNPGYMNGDAYKGAQIAVAEAARNIICAGGTPLAVSDCLNFGNPADPKAYGAFVASVKGVADICKYFSLPVISGNVSFYNQRSVEGRIVPVTPSPIIGMVGLLNDKKHHTTLAFKHKGDMIFLIGRSRNDVNGSEYLRRIHKIDETVPPFFDMQEERELHQVISGLINKQLVRSVHDVSNGGLFFTLLECGIPIEFGFDITTDAEIRKDAFLFGESQSRVVVSVAPEQQDDFVDYMVEQEFPFSILGHVTKGEVRIDDESYGFISDIKKDFESYLQKWVDGLV